MKRQLSASFVATLAAGLVLSLSPPPVSGQDYTPPRNAFGQPDLSGFWRAMNTARYNVEAHSGSYGIPAGTGVITSTPDGLIPYRPGGRDEQQRNFEARATEDPVNQCLKPGVPRLIYLGFPLQIIQRPEQVTIISEYIHNYRNIFLNRAEHLDLVEFWNGDTIGRWEGDTLVTSVSGFQGETWLDAAGNHHSPGLRVEERFTLIGPDHMRYEATLTDPDTYLSPWTMSMILYRHKEENFKILEYECHAYVEDYYVNRERQQQEPGQ